MWMPIGSVVLVLIIILFKFVESEDSHLVIDFLCLLSPGGLIERIVNNFVQTLC